MGNVLQKWITVEEFYKKIPDGQKADLIDGAIYMASPDSRQQNLLTEFLVVLMKTYTDVKGLGEVFSSRFAFTLTPYRAPEPDVAFVRKERLYLVHDTGMKGGPDIAVEIVSLDSKERDYQSKKKSYEEAMVSEYWVIDPLQEKAIFYRLVNEKYQRVFLKKKNLFQSVVLEDFVLDTNWLWMDPLPPVEEILLPYIGVEKIVKTVDKNTLLRKLILEMSQEEVQMILKEGKE